MFNANILFQDPVIFSGSIRRNIDPFSRYNDSDVWQSLEHAYLKDFISSLPSGLDYDCGENGEALRYGIQLLNEKKLFFLLMISCNS